MELKDNKTKQNTEVGQEENANLELMWEHYWMTSGKIVETSLKMHLGARISQWS